MAERPALRADARRNLEKLLAAAREVFCERGLNTPLEAVATRAGVSIGTLYNRFPTRDDLIDAALPHRVAEAMAEAAGHALEQSTPWLRFATYLENLCALQAGDRVISDLLAGAAHTSVALTAACDRALELAATLTAAAQADGALRGDITVDDLYIAFWLSGRLGEHAGADAAPAARRHICLYLDGLRSAAATALPADHHAAAAAARRLMGPP